MRKEAWGKFVRRLVAGAKDDNGRMPVRAVEDARPYKPHRIWCGANLFFIISSFFFILSHPYCTYPHGRPLVVPTIGSVRDVGEGLCALPICAFSLREGMEPLPYNPILPDALP